MVRQLVRPAHSALSEWVQLVINAFVKYTHTLAFVIGNEVLTVDVTHPGARRRAGRVVWCMPGVRSLRNRRMVVRCTP